GVRQWQWWGSFWCACLHYRRAVGPQTAQPGYDERVIVHKADCRLRQWDPSVGMWDSRGFVRGGGVGFRGSWVRGRVRPLPWIRLGRLAGPAIGADIVDDDSDRAQAGDERAVQRP